jgi:hypothetical protein
MSRCENRGICSFYDRSSGVLSAETVAMLNAYCKSDKEHCARYLVKRKVFEGFTLPGDLNLDKVGRHLEKMAPTEHARARKIIDRMVM